MINLTLRQEVAQMVMPRLDGMKLEDPRYCQRSKRSFRRDRRIYPVRGQSSILRASPGNSGFCKDPLLIAADMNAALASNLPGNAVPNQRAVASAVNRRSRKDVALLDSMLDAVRIETRSVGFMQFFSRR